MSNAAAVRIIGLGHTYLGQPVPALLEISFDVAPGEVVAVLGPSGAGKTTLFRCLTQLIEPAEGTVELAGRRPVGLRGRELRQARREVGLIFQQYNLVRRLTAEENVLAGRLGHVPTWRVVLRHFERDDRALATACLARVGLSERPTSVPTGCPGGSSSAWRSLACSRSRARSCSPTNLSQASTRQRPQMCSTCCAE